MFVKAPVGLAKGIKRYVHKVPWGDTYCRCYQLDWTPKVPFHSSTGSMYHGNHQIHGTKGASSHNQPFLNLLICH